MGKLKIVETKSSASFINVSAVPRNFNFSSKIIWYQYCSIISKSWCLILKVNHFRKCITLDLAILSVVQFTFFFSERTFLSVYNKIQIFSSSVCTPLLSSFSSNVNNSSKKKGKWKVFPGSICTVELICMNTIDRYSCFCALHVDLC